ncbi:DUF2863 family protein [Verticiella sediminum]|uniref:DUF2863 family protein n=1 Tax=Verticiella sediminum TaxID=1247510 RepID=A0A556AYQ9_9BURK|nr:DUF2863 family protein [Verticiella sediminum]TSH98058.1 DUF2863 family protein [Verticiella sediminum]
MPRSRSVSASQRASHRDTDRLVLLAQSLAASSSRVEDRYWERQLDALLGKLMRAGQDGPIDGALDDLFTRDPAAYDVLAELCETQSESQVFEKDGERYEALLVVAPLAVWTRYSIPSGKMRRDAIEALQAQLHGHVLAKEARLALVPGLLSIDQMPRSFSATQQWLHRLTLQALGKNTTQKVSLPEDAETAEMLADTRYVAGVVVVKEGEPVFRWQETPEDPSASRAACLAGWQAQAEPTFTGLLPGCGFEILLPDAWYMGNREADRCVRPLSVRAAVSWLETTANFPPDHLRAVIAGIGEQQIDEYRIGFTERNSNDVIYGVVWPLFGREPAEPGMAGDDAPVGALDEIVELLKSLGVTDIRRLPGILPPEFCDDCGAPFFPDPLGVLEHAELPADVDPSPQHFH